MKTPIRLVSGNKSIAIALNLINGNPAIDLGFIDETTPLVEKDGKLLYDSGKSDLSIEFLNVEALDVWFEHLYAIRVELLRRESEL